MSPVLRRAALLAALLLFPTFSATAQTAARKPHIVMVLFDAARADFFGVYGQKDPTTPNIDRLAKDGIVFRNHYSNAVNTRTALSHMFTSRYEAFPVLDFYVSMGKDYAWWMRDEIIPPDATLLPKVMRESGYRTVIVSAHPFTTEQTVLLKSFREFVRVQPAKGEPFAPAERVFAVAKDVVSKHERRSPNKPLFLYVHVLDTHMPYQPSGSENAFIKGRAREWPAAERTKRRPLALPNMQENLDPNAIELLRGEAKSRYAYTDAQFASFVETMQRDFRHPHAWLLTADHGDALGEDDRIGHDYSMFAMKELHHIPLIAGGPALRAQPRSVEAFTATVDLFPTVLGLAGLPVPSRVRIDGESLLPLARGTKTTHRPGVLEIMRISWKTSRLAFRTPGATHVVTEWDEAYRREDDDREFQRIDIKDIPAPFADLVARYRVREQRRQFLARGREMYLPVHDLVLDPSLRNERGICWAIPPWRYYQDRYPLRIEEKCPPLRLRADLPNGVYRATWHAGSAEKCDAPTRPAVTIQTSGSSKPHTFTCADVASGALDLGMVSIRDGALRLWAKHLATPFWLAGISLQRTDQSLGQDRKLSPEEIERLRSLGYIQ